MLPHRTNCGGQYS